MNYLSKKIIAVFLLIVWFFVGWPKIPINNTFPPNTPTTKASHTITFVFDTDAEGWTYTDNCAALNGAFTSGIGNPAGSLQTSGNKGAGAQSCSYNWEWTGTWEDLGVTAGHEVTGVSGSYDHAVSADNSGGTWSTGAFELRDSGGTLRSTLITALTGQSGALIFTNRSGTEQTFTAEASTTNIRLRLNGGVEFIAGNRDWTGQKDNIALTISHSAVASVSISLDTNGSVSFGHQPLDTTQDTTASGINDTETIRVDTGPADLDVRSTAFSDGSNTWSLSTANGSNQVLWEFSPNGSAWTTFALANTLYALAANVSQSSTQNIYFRLTTPTTTSSYNQHSTTITIQASVP